MRVCLLLSAVVVVGSGCTSKSTPATDTAAVVTQAGGDVGTVRSAIDSANARFIAALLKGDTATAIQNYASDAIVMMPNAAESQGHDAISKAFSAFLSQFTLKDWKADTRDVMVNGDLALETGRYVMTVVPKGGKQMTDSGKYLTAWKRQPDGSWKIIRDINNSDLPAK